MPLDDQNCRLCEGKTFAKFKLTLLKRYIIQYSECVTCRSLQTETPYWINEAYESNLADLDTGAAQRNLLNLAASYLVSKIFNFPNVLDYGGGDGLLCRLLRDHEINCFVKDQYAKVTYAQGFSTPNFSSPDLLLSFEVAEHFVNPKDDLITLFQSQPKALLVSTGIYQGQGSDWWYLTPATGQHVFFYSKKALCLIAKKMGYEVQFCGDYVIFIQLAHRSYLKTSLLRILLRSRILKLAKAALCLLPTGGVWRDFKLLSK